MFVSLTKCLYHLQNFINNTYKILLTILITVVFTKENF